MPQHTDVTIPVRHYTRADFTALRAMINRVPLATILSLYYCEDDQIKYGLVDSMALQRFLDEMRDDLIQRSSDTNPHLARILQDARRTSIWSKSAIDHLVHAADAKTSAPAPADPLTMWFRGAIAIRLKNEGCRTVMDIVTMINRRGYHWYRPIIRIGAGKAKAITTWLMKHEAIAKHLDPDALTVPRRVEGQRRIDPGDAPIPLDRATLPFYLDGSQGENRSRLTCTVDIANDIEALSAYILKFDRNQSTARSFRKEIERLILWSVLHNSSAMSDLNKDDCCKFLDFLRNPPENWIGPKKPRTSKYWRPFTGSPSDSSIRYTVQTIRTFFNWLVTVRYLASNPWQQISIDSAREPSRNEAEVDHLTQGQWENLKSTLTTYCSFSDDELKTRFKLRGDATRISLQGQFKIAYAAVLMAGQAGMRPSEIANSCRHAIQADSTGWWLSAPRTIFLHADIVRVLKDHWDDVGDGSTWILTPLVTPNTGIRASTDGFTASSLQHVVKTALSRIATDVSEDLKAVIGNTTLRSIRHTFGYRLAKTMQPADLAKIMHGSVSRYYATEASDDKVRWAHVLTQN